METIDHYISLRKLRWAGHIARMPMERFPRKFLTSWVHHARPHGRPQYTFGHSLNKTFMAAGRHIDGLQEVEGASTGPHALEGPHLQHRQISPGDRA